MAWQTPKTNWDTVPKNPKSEDLNRIEGNIDFLKTDIETKKGLIVNSMVSNLNRSVTIANTHQELANALVEPTLITGNIKAGASIFGVSGKPSVVDTADATIVAGDVLSGKTGYKNGAKITGSIPSKGAATITPGTTNQTISAGQYLSGAQTIAGDANLIAANIKRGASIFGVNGSAGVGIKSIQTGTASVPYYWDNTVNLNVTISSVDLSSSILLVELTGATKTGYACGLSVCKLTSSTNINLDAYNVNTSGTGVGVVWKVIEFDPNMVKSLQKGDFSIPAATPSTNIALSSVIASKSLVVIAGGTVASTSSSDPVLSGVGGLLTSSTNLNLVRLSTIGTMTGHWQVIEFY